jgi:hypothetical protein
VADGLELTRRGEVAEYAKPSLHHLWPRMAWDDLPTYHAPAERMPSAWLVAVEASFDQLSSWFGVFFSRRRPDVLPPRRRINASMALLFPAVPLFFVFLSHSYFLLVVCQARLFYQKCRAWSRQSRAKKRWSILCRILAHITRTSTPTPTNHQLSPSPRLLTILSSLQRPLIRLPLASRLTYWSKRHGASARHSLTGANRSTSRSVPKDQAAVSPHSASGPT